VKRAEEAGGHCTVAQASEFLDAVLASYCAASPGAPPGTPTLYLCESAVDVVRRHPQLAQARPHAHPFSQS
jgi:hypothetical protein